MSDLADAGFPRSHVKKKTALAKGYDSDSEAPVSGDDSDASDDTKECGKELQHHKDDLELAENGSDDDPPESQSTNVLDIDQFEKEQGLENYHFREEHFDGDNANSVIKLEAFSLREEVESGKFDKDMNYIHLTNTDSEDQDEPWMAEASAEDMAKARKAQDITKLKQENVTDLKLVLATLHDLISLLEPAETSMEALARLRPAKKKKRLHNNEQFYDHGKDASRKKMVFQITECCELLVNENGVSSAYYMSREELMRAFRQETGHDFEMKNTQSTKRTADEMENEGSEFDECGEAVWEYRWIGEAQVNGPYYGYEMQYWKDTYFEGKVEVRRLGQSEFRHVSKAEF